MVMVEVLNSPLASSISIYSYTHRNYLCCGSRRNVLRLQLQCISCCAYINMGLSVKTSCRKQIRETVFPIRKDNSCVFPSKVARLESICEEERSPFVKENEDFSEYYPKQALPPWGNLVEHDLQNRNHVDKPSEISMGNNDEIEGEIYYLEERDVETLSRRIVKLSRANKIRSALALYRSMERSSLLPNSHSCNSLLSCLLRNGRLNDALKIFEFMKANEVMTGHTYSLILKAVANVRNCDAALSIFEEAERDCKTKKYMDAIVYNTMITMFGKMNDWVQVNRIWRSLQENGLKGTEVTYRLLVCIFVRCGQNELALDAYHQMVQNEISPHDDTMEAIIGACTREGKWDMALNVMQSMLNSGIKPSVIACNALIISLGKAAKVELAFKVYGFMKSLGYEPNSYTWNALLVALNRANKHADALLLFESIRKEHSISLNLHIYNTCLMSCQRLGLWEKALQLLWQMETSGMSVSVTSYNLVIGACEASRKPKVALKVYKHMLQQEHSPDIFTLLSLIRQCCWGSLWNEVDEILDYAPNGSVYNAAIQGMCLSKNTDLAKKMYLKMHEIGLIPDGKTRALMLQKQRKKY